MQPIPLPPDADQVAGHSALRAWLAIAEPRCVKTLSGKTAYRWLDLRRYVADRLLPRIFRP